MTGAEYAYQIDDDYEIEVPTKRFSFLSLLSKIRNICILDYSPVIAPVLYG